MEVSKLVENNLYGVPIIEAVVNKNLREHLIDSGFKHHKTGMIHYFSLSGMNDSQAKIHRDAIHAKLKESNYKMHGSAANGSTVGEVHYHQEANPDHTIIMHQVHNGSGGHKLVVAHRSI